MSRLAVLVRGEFDRLNKYHLFKANLVVLLFYLGAAWFLDGEDLRLFVPVIFLMDATMMTILLVGATLFYEKQEHTINSIMVSPVSEDEYLAAKVIVNVINSLLTVLIVSAVLYFMKQVTLNYLLLLPAVTVVTVSHVYIGIWLSYHAKNFTGLLVNYMVYVLFFLTPSLFAAFGLISADAVRYLIVLPPEASNILIGAAVRDVETGRLLFGYGYLIVLSFLVYRYVVKPAFGRYVMRETGV